MQAKVHAETYATHEERGISNRAKCSARSAEIHGQLHAEKHAKMYAKTQASIPGELSLLSLSLLFFSTEWERQKFL